MLTKPGTLPIAFISEIHGKHRLDKAGTSANENMQNRLKAIDQDLGTQSYFSQNGLLTKIFAKVVNLPSATFQLVVQGTYRQHKGLSPKFR